MLTSSSPTGHFAALGMAVNVVIVCARGRDSSRGASPGKNAGSMVVGNFV